MPTTPSHAVPVLADVVAALGGHVVRLVVAPRGLSLPVADVVMLEPDEGHELRLGDVVLAVGMRVGSTRPVIAAAGRAKAAAVIVRAGPRAALGPARAAAEDANVALLTIGPDARWERVLSLATSVTTRDPWTNSVEDSDLFALARTLMTLTGGSVSIEDTSNRVVAYSTKPGEADDLRIHSILGRRGPETFLAMLRDWGVYDSLRVPERVVEVEARPDLGWHRRLAVAIFGAERQLGSIWLQEGSVPLASNSDELLLGAMRLAASSLVGDIAGSPEIVSARRQLLIRGLSGELPTAAVASRLDLLHDRPACLVAIGVPNLGDADTAFVERSRVAERLAVHASAFRPGATVVTYGHLVFLLMPMQAAEPAQTLVAFLERTLPAMQREMRLPLRAALASISLVGSSLRDASRELERAMDHAQGRPDTVTRLDEIRNELQLDDVVRMAMKTGLLTHSGLVKLRDYDHSKGADMTLALRVFLDRGADVAAAAEILHVHPNTVRYRTRRALDITGVDVRNAEQRLFLELALRTLDLGADGDS